MDTRVRAEMHTHAAVDGRTRTFLRIRTRVDVLQPPPRSGKFTSKRSPDLIHGSNMTSSLVEFTFAAIFPREFDRHTPIRRLLSLPDAMPPSGPFIVNFAPLPLYPQPPLVLSFNFPNHCLLKIFSSR